MHRNYLIGLLLTAILVVSSCTATKMYEGADVDFRNKLTKNI